MQNKIYLPCGATISVGEIRTYSKIREDGNNNWYPYADLYISTEVHVPMCEEDEKCNELKEKVNIPLQLRSIEPLIIFLKQLKEELQK